MKFFIIIIIAAIIYGMYHFREKWLPKLRGIGDTYQTVVNDGKLAEGNFPIEIFGESNYQLEYSSDVLFLLNDAYIYLYNQEGGLLDSRQHAYSNAILKASAGKALIYESGGYKLRVEGKNKTSYSATMEHPIIFARISADGFVAAVTTSGNFTCELTIYDNKGKVVYVRECVERIIDISFMNGSVGAMISYVMEINGALVTEFEKASFTSAEAKHKSNPVSSYCLMSNIYNGGAVIIGDLNCAYFNDLGNIAMTYDYDGKFAGCDISGESAAIILKNEERRKYSLVLIKNAQTFPVVINSDEEFRHVLIYNGLVYAMSGGSIRAYDFSGQIRSTATISDSYDHFRRCDRYIFLMNYDRIDRIDYDS